MLIILDFNSGKFSRLSKRWERINVGKAFEGMKGLFGLSYKTSQGLFSRKKVNQTANNNQQTASCIYSFRTVFLAKFMWSISPRWETFWLEKESWVSVCYLMVGLGTEAQWVFVFVLNFICWIFSFYICLNFDLVSLCYLMVGLGTGGPWDAPGKRHLTFLSAAYVPPTLFNPFLILFNLFWTFFLLLMYHPPFLTPF